MTAVDATCRMVGVAMLKGSDSEAVVRLVVAHQDEIYRHIYSLCAIEDDARDVLQETSVALLRNAEAYDPQRPFLPWAYQFARMEVLKHRERVARTKRVFQEDVIDLVSRQRQSMDQELQAGLAELERCLELLSKNDRRMIEARYSRRCDVQRLATEWGISRRTLVRNLQRIRRLLTDCITARTARATS